MPADKADCTVTMKDADFVKIMSGQMKPQTVSLFFLMSSLLYPADSVGVSRGYGILRLSRFAVMLD